jgi:hypothetical protein
MTIYAKKDYITHLNSITTLKNEQGKVIKIITGYQQPNRNLKQILFKNQICKLIWQ